MKFTAQSRPLLLATPDRRHSPVVDLKIVWLLAFALRGLTPKKSSMRPCAQMAAGSARRQMAKVLIVDLIKECFLFIANNDQVA